MDLFSEAVLCQGSGYIPGTEVRARAIVGLVMRLAAKIEKQPKKGRLIFAAGKIENGMPMPKRCYDRIGKVTWVQIGMIYLEFCCENFPPNT